MPAIYVPPKLEKTLNSNFPDPELPTKTSNRDRNGQKCVDNSENHGLRAIFPAENRPNSKISRLRRAGRLLAGISRSFSGKNGLADLGGAGFLADRALRRRTNVERQRFVVSPPRFRNNLSTDLSWVFLWLCVCANGNLMFVRGSVGHCRNTTVELSAARHTPGVDGETPRVLHGVAAG